jgi:nucleotide-binding universal stress UspA family protein
MRIILASDPATPYENLVEQVTSRKWPAGAEFKVVAAVEPLPQDLFIEIPDLMVHAEAQASKHAEEHLQAIAAAMRAAGLQVTTIMIGGDPHDAIVEQANEWKADLILLGAPRREGGFPALNNRVARAVIRHAHCSVQILRTGAVKKVLVPTDGSKYSLQAAQAVATRPWDNDTVFEVVSVVEPLTRAVRYLYPPYGMLSDDSAEAQVLREQEMQHVVNAIKKTEQILTGAGLSISDHVLINVDAPGKLILKEAETWGADLIVLGSHGRRGIKRLLIGSVSESVAIHATCSVELVR